MPTNTTARDRNVLFAVSGLALISAFLAVTWATPFASNASSEDLGTFLESLVIPLLTLVLGAILLSVGVAPLLTSSHAESEERARSSRTAGSTNRLAMLATLLGVLGGGCGFIGWEMVSPSTCSASHTSSMGIIGPVCPIPFDVTLLSDVLLVAGGLMAGAGILSAVALRMGGRRTSSVKSGLDSK